MPRTLLIAGVIALLASPAAAEVVQRSADSFTLRYELGAEIVDFDDLETIEVTTLELCLPGPDLCCDVALRRGLVAMWQAEAELAGLELKPRLLELQVFAVEAHYEEGPFPLPAEREVLLNDLELLLHRCEAELGGTGH